MSLSVCGVCGREYGHARDCPYWTPASPTPPALPDEAGEMVEKLKHLRLRYNGEIPPNVVGILTQAASLIERLAQRSQGADAIALLYLLGETPPIKRWKEYEERGEERIPCFIAVETAKAIAEFFPPQKGST